MGEIELQVTEEQIDYMWCTCYMVAELTYMARRTLDWLRRSMTIA